MLRLSGTSSALLLRLGAGLVAPTLGVLVGSRVLPKLPGVGGAGVGSCYVPATVHTIYINCKEQKN